MKTTVLAGIAMIGLALASCGREPSGPPPTSRTTAWENTGAPFRARWTWSSSAPRSAHVVLTVTPTRAGHSLTIQARLPAGMSLAGGELHRTLTMPAAGVPTTLTFDVAFAPDLDPLIPVEVLLAAAEDPPLAVTIPVRDPDAPVRPAKTQGSGLDAAGFPARVAGEMEPSRRKEDK